MKSSALLLLALAVAPVCNGTPRCYFDPLNGTTRYEELSRPAKPLLLKLSVSRRTSIPHNEQSLEDRLREQVVRVLRKSGLIQSSYAAEDGSITITFGYAEQKSWVERRGPGLHERAVYELEAVLSAGGRTVTKAYERALLCYNGKAKAGEGLTGPVGAVEAVDSIAEQMLLHALHDFQQEGVIPTGVSQPEAATEPVSP